MLDANNYKHKEYTLKDQNKDNKLDCSIVSMLIK